MTESICRFPFVSAPQYQKSEGTMPFQVTSIYAAMIVLGVLILSNVVSANRGRTGTSIYHGEDQRLGLAVRRHGNLVENAALAMLMLALCEARGLPGWGLHTLGLILVASRIAHAIGLDADNPMKPLRIAGGAGTQLVLLATAGYLLWSQF
ncbi:MAPEG family protein [Mesorhizobium sp. CAU 1741]|uniref:MAPEG family protein n=1 Tax=Mesorhizobium sp. CAU 1741 TaxID=3140366 RepID=UPI00325B812D